MLQAPHGSGVPQHAYEVVGALGEGYDLLTEKFEQLSSALNDGLDHPEGVLFIASRALVL